MGLRGGGGCRHAPLEPSPDALMEEIADGRVDVADDHEAERHFDLTRKKIDEQEVEATMKTRYVSALTKLHDERESRANAGPAPGARALLRALHCVE